MNFSGLTVRQLSERAVQDVPLLFLVVILVVVIVVVVVYAKIVEKCYQGG